MRLISQDRTIDIPYERTMLKADNISILAIWGNEIFRMGVYDSHERAKKVMIEVRNQWTEYGNNTLFYKFPKN